MKRRLATFSIIIFFTGSLLFLNACTPTGDDVDTTPPEVTLQLPDEDAEDIVITSDISVTFNKRVLNVNSNTLYLEKVGSYGQIQATIQYDDTTHTAILNPAENLDPDKIYLVTLMKGITSRAGVSMKPVSWTFTTKAESDTTPPIVDSASPAINSFVATDSEISVTFKEGDIQPSTLNSATFYLKKKSTDEIVPSTVDFSDVSKKAELTDVVLEEWTEYILVAEDSITDTSGNNFAGYEFNFKTDDKSEPEIMTRTPDIGESDIPQNTSISILFSEKLKISTIHNNNHCCPKEI